MAIRDQLVREFENEIDFTLQEAFDLGFKKGSVSSALSRGIKTNAFERLARGLYKVIQVFYEKLLGSQNYCSGKKVNYLALTIEDNDINRLAFLQDVLDNIEGCSPVRKIKRGYQQRITDKRDPIYPGFEVIET